MSYDAALFGTGEDGNLTAFASDLRLEPFHFPNLLVIKKDGKELRCEVQQWVRDDNGELLYVTYYGPNDTRILVFND